jgi:hypothetical protein
MSQKKAAGQEDYLQINIIMTPSFCSVIVATLVPDGTPDVLSPMPSHSQVFLFTSPTV